MNTVETIMRDMARGWDELEHPDRILSFVLEHGRPFFKVRQGKVGEPQECFCNAGRLVMLDDKLTYCEGYVADEEIGFPFLHAWYLDTDGYAVEVTLRPDREYTYYGIAYRHGYFCKGLVEYGVWGILGGHPKQAHDLICEHGVDALNQEWGS
jgi:hypothetical protein